MFLIMKKTPLRGVYCFNNNIHFMKSIALYDKYSVNVYQNRGHILPNHNMRVNEVRADIKGEGEI